LLVLVHYNISHGRRDGKPQRQLIRRDLAEEAASLPPEPYPREAAHQSSGWSGGPQRRFTGFEVRLRLDVLTTTSLARIQAGMGYRQTWNNCGHKQA